MKIINVRNSPKPVMSQSEWFNLGKTARWFGQDEMFRLDVEDFVVEATKLLSSKTASAKMTQVLRKQAQSPNGFVSDRQMIPDITGPYKGNKSEAQPSAFPNAKGGDKYESGYSAQAYAAEELYTTGQALQAAIGAFEEKKHGFDAVKPAYQKFKETLQSIVETFFKPNVSNIGSAAKNILTNMPKGLMQTKQWLSTLLLHIGNKIQQMSQAKAVRPQLDAIQGMTPKHMLPPKPAPAPAMSSPAGTQAPQGEHLPQIAAMFKAIKKVYAAA